MGKGVFTNISGAIGIPGDRRYRRSLRQRLMTSVTVMPLSTADETDHAGPRRLRRAGKARGGPTGAALGGIVGVALSTLLAGAAYANPNGGTVTAGAATIREATPKSLEVVQSSDKAVINWKSFSVGADEAVRFRQPSKDSVTLNRVTGNDPSAILGSVSANGTVMLVNPNGVVFGAGAKVDVGGLVATTANISDADFMAGRYVFDQASGKPDAVVANEGDINIRDSGLAALVAPHVRNSGVIRAKLGKVALGGAQTFTLDFHGDGLISFDAGSAVATAAKDADGNPVKALVVNTGEVSAEGGTVTLSARAVKGVIDNVINTTGIVKATSVSGSNGRIVLSGGDVGTVAIGGVVDAGGGAGQTGGTVVATGAEIAIAGKTVIDASGHQGGGTVSIGSAPGRDGKWSEKVSVGTGAILSADAVKAGKGGTVTVLSDKKTRHAGRISARGGEQGGDGGFAEVSSRKDIVLTGEVDLSAPKGMSGVFLLDPETLRIVGPSGGSQNTAAGDGAVSVGDVDLGSDSNINTISRSVLEGIAGTASIVLEASGQITVETGLDLQTAAGRSFTLRSLGAGGGISFTDNANQISTNGGDINLEAQGVGATLGNIGKLATKGGAVQLSANGSIQVANQIDTTPTTGTAGAITVRSMTGSITATTPAKLTGGSVTLSAVNGGIGASGAPVATSTRQLTLETGRDSRRQRSGLDPPDPGRAAHTNRRGRNLAALLDRPDLRHGGILRPAVRQHDQPDRRPDRARRHRRPRRAGRRRERRHGLRQPDGRRRRPHGGDGQPRDRRIGDPDGEGDDRPGRRHRDRRLVHRHRRFLVDRRVRQQGLLPRQHRRRDACQPRRHGQRVERHGQRRYHGGGGVAGAGIGVRQPDPDLQRRRHPRRRRRRHDDPRHRADARRRRRHRFGGHRVDDDGRDGHRLVRNRRSHLSTAGAATFSSVTSTNGAISLSSAGAATFSSVTSTNGAISLSSAGAAS